MSDFIWPSDAARAENPELNRVCEELEDVIDELDGAKSTPYQLAVHELKDALDHIQRMALASRTQTRRLRRIAARANAALEAREFDPSEVKSLKDARTPQSYELELRVLKRELASNLGREAALAAHVIEKCDQLKYSDSGQARYNAALNDIQTYVREVLPKSDVLAQRDHLKQAELAERLADEYSLNASNARENEYFAAADAMEDAANEALEIAASLREQAVGGA